MGAKFRLAPVPGHTPVAVPSGPPPVHRLEFWIIVFIVQGLGKYMFFSIFGYLDPGATCFSQECHP